MPDAEGRLRSARAHVETAVTALLTPNPDTLTRSEGALAAAIAEISQAHKEGGGNPLPDALALRREVRKAASLLDRARQFYDGWSRVLGSLTAGYTPLGEAAVPASSHRICLQG